MERIIKNSITIDYKKKTLEQKPIVFILKTGKEKRTSRRILMYKIMDNCDAKFVPNKRHVHI